jgi:hypothetical protein
VTSRTVGEICLITSVLIIIGENKGYLHKTYLAFQYTSRGKGKGKTIPLQAWTGPEGSRKLRLPNYKTIGT